MNSPPDLSDPQFSAEDARAWAHAHHSPSFDPDASADPAALTAHKQIFTQLLDDLFEAFAPLHIAGIAFPDPDLPEEFLSLASRCDALGLSTPTLLARLLAVELAALLHARTHTSRTEHTRAAWNLTAKLVSWHRLFTTELHLLTIESSFRSKRTTHTHTNRANVADATLIPIGWHFTPEHHDLYCLRADTGAPVRVRDTLSDLQHFNPLHLPAISRFFKNRIALSKTLTHALELSQQPRSFTQHLPTFTPSFTSTPTLRPLPNTLPNLPSWVLSEHGQLRTSKHTTPHPFSLGEIDAFAQRDLTQHPTLCDETNTILPIDLSPIARFNLLKLLAFSSPTRVHLQCVFLTLPDTPPTLLRAHTTHGPKLALSIDPYAVSIDTERTQTTLTDQAPTTAPPLLHHALQCALHTLPSSPVPSKTLLSQLDQTPTQGCEALFIQALARASIHANHHPETLQTTALEVLRVATNRRIQPTQWTRALGRPLNTPHPWTSLFLPPSHPYNQPKIDDSHPLHCDVLLRSLLLISWAGGANADTLPLLHTLRKERFSTPMERFSVPEMCTRALLSALSLDDWGDYDPTDALTLYQAHLHDLTPDLQHPPTQSSLSLHDLLTLALTHNALHLHPPFALLATTPPWLSFHPLNLSNLCAEAIVGALREATPRTYADAITAFWVLRIFGLSNMVFST